MPTTFQSGAGNKIKVFCALLPLGIRTEPIDVTLTTTAAASANATTIAVSSLSGAIAGGTPLTFGTGASAVTAYLSADATAGDTSISVEPLSAPIGNTTTATYTSKLRLLGGTSTGATIGAERTESLVFEDPLGYSDGLVTSQNWEVPWTANLLADDDAYRRVYYAASQAVSGRELFLWQEDAPPAGATEGDGLKGAVVVTNFTKDFPSDGILTFNCTFTGQGSPTITRYS